MDNAPKKSFLERYFITAGCIFLTLGAFWYFFQLSAHFAPKSEVAALKSEVKQTNAQAAAVVTEVKQQNAQAAGSAKDAKAAAQQAQVAADIVKEHRIFMTGKTAQQINDLDVRVRSNTRDIHTNSDQIKALQQHR